MAKHIVIIGNGIAGITCARTLRKLSQDEITVISSETDHFYSRTALMYIYMGHMKYEHTKPYEDWFWEKNRISLVKDFVTLISTDTKELHVKSGKIIKYDKLVIATGSVSNTPDIPGVALQGVQTLYGMPDLEMMIRNTENVKHAVVLGGGLIGIEMAEMLLSQKISVTFLIRENAYWNNVLPAEEAEMVSRHIKEHHIDLRIATGLREIVGDSEGRVRSVITDKGEEITTGFLGLTVGVSPNIGVIQGTGIKAGRGILVNEYFETNITDVYAIGDCAQHINPPNGRKAVEQVWYTGKMQGETLALTLHGKRTKYDPGIWYNSAKFFDIEYQTYGTVNAAAQQNEHSFYWEHKDSRISFRVVYNAETRAVTGFNAMGMRLRHAVCDKWIKEGRSVDEVMRNLQLVNFDAEFSRRYHNEMLESYNVTAGVDLKNKGEVQSV